MSEATRSTTTSPSTGSPLPGWSRPGRQVTNAGRPAGRLPRAHKADRHRNHHDRRKKRPGQGRRAGQGRAVHDDPESRGIPRHDRSGRARLCRCHRVRTHRPSAGHAPGEQGDSADRAWAGSPSWTVVWDLLEQDVAPGGTRRNLAAADPAVLWNGAGETARLLLCDAQTSGGLLIAVPPARKDRLVRELEARRVEAAAVIGEVAAPGAFRRPSRRGRAVALFLKPRRSSLGAAALALAATLIIACGSEPLPTPTASPPPHACPHRPRPLQPQLYGHRCTHGDSYANACCHLHGNASTHVRA